MLTVFLLVVLGGGAGLLTVWWVHASSRPRLDGRPEGRSLRATTGEHTAREASADAALAALASRPGAPMAPDAGGSTPQGEPVGGPEKVPAPVLEVVATPPAPDRVSTPVDATPPAGPVRRRRRGDVPAAYTAVEGTYREVAVVPLWRKALSLVLLLAVLMVVGVGLAALTGAALGIAAELVDGAIG